MPTWKIGKKNIKALKSNFEIKGTDGDVSSSAFFSIYSFYLSALLQ